MAQARDQTTDQAGAVPGTHMRAEIAEQPQIFADLLAQRERVAEVAALIAERRPRFALLAARGSSDHAALYAKYLLEVLLELPAGLVSASSTTLYGARPDLTDVLLLTVSQSGGSPDLVEVTRTARERGATTVAVTNTTDSPLNSAAELAVDIGAGTERAVAATKTYSATLLTLYLLIDAVRGGAAAAARELPDLASSTLDADRTQVENAVARYRFAEQMVTTGRGFSLASASEAALKLAETSYLSARAYSGADLLHGPVAAVDVDTAVLGDPALDLANLRAHASWRELQGIWNAEHARIAREEIDAAALRARIPAATLAAYESGTLARLTCVYAFRPRWRALARELAADLRPAPGAPPVAPDDLLHTPDERTVTT